ncbi:MAG: SURF1 family protein [Chloroflexales bacterium]|nr:SURF1 family protein [Chloroflexales bacterium]
MRTTQLFWQGRRRYLTIAVVIGVILLSRLGVWQFDRHIQRITHNQLISDRMHMTALPISQLIVLPSADRDFRRVSAVGQYDAAHQILWRNRSYAGRTGFQILTPLQSDDGAVVLVNRGWVPYESVNTAWSTQFAPPMGLQTVIGVWRESQASSTTVDEAPLVNGWRDKWFLITIPAIQSQIPLPLAPGFIDVQPDGSPQAANQPIPIFTTDMGMGSNLSYAIQWFGFAVILAVGYVVVVGRMRL